MDGQEQSEQELLKELISRNHFSVDVVSPGPRTRYPVFHIDSMLHYPEGTMEREGRGGHGSHSHHVNPRYVRMEERAYMDDAVRHGADLLFTWSLEAKKLEAERSGKFLPEEDMEKEDAERTLDDEQIWDPSGYDCVLENSHGSHSDVILNMARRETAEYWIRRYMGEEAGSERIREARTRGLRKLKDHEEGRLFTGLIFAIDGFEYQWRYGRSPASQKMGNLLHSKQHYDRICSELGVVPVNFGFVGELARLELEYGSAVPFEKHAKLLVDELVRRGKKQYHRGSFDVWIGKRRATVRHTSCGCRHNEPPETREAIIKL